MRSKAITYYIISILLLCLASCSEWDTYTAGTKFQPANSQVRNFRRQVYVEYGPHSASVWGEAADLVEAEVEDCHVSLKFDKDSIAIFVYGYTTADTTQVGGNASLTIRANTRTGYALYLSNASLYNPHGPAIQSLTSDQCFLVLPPSTNNHLVTADMDGAEDNANACVYVEGPLQISGSGNLSIRNLARNASRGNAITAGAFGCSYNVNATINSASGNAILSATTINISSGKWDIMSDLSNFKGDFVLLTSGTFSAHSQRGSFVETYDFYSVPAVLRNPTVTSLAPRFTNVADSAQMVSLGYVADSLYYPKHYMPDFEFHKDSTYTVYSVRDSVENRLSTFTPKASLSEGYLLITNSSLSNRDYIVVKE